MSADPDNFNPLADSNRRPSRNVQLIELLVFLFLIVPSLVLSFFSSVQSNAGFVLVAVSTIFRDLALLSLVIYFVWRNKEGIRSVGWSLRNGWTEVVVGLLLFVPTYFAAALLESALSSAGLSTPSQSQTSFLVPQGAGQIALAVALVIVVAVAEETIFRGYLILRFKGVTFNVAAAIVLSAFIFSLGHGYEGSAGVLTVGFLGLVYAIVYVWRKSLIAPMVMHFAQDFIAIVIASLLGLG